MPEVRYEVSPILAQSHVTNTQNEIINFTSENTGTNSYPILHSVSTSSECFYNKGKALESITPVRTFGSYNKGFTLISV